MFRRRQKLNARILAKPKFSVPSRTGLWSKFLSSITLALAPMADFGSVLAIIFVFSEVGFWMAVAAALGLLLSFYLWTPGNFCVLLGFVFWCNLQWHIQPFDHAFNHDSTHASQHWSFNLIPSTRSPLTQLHCSSSHLCSLMLIGAR